MVIMDLRIMFGVTVVVVIVGVLTTGESTETDNLSSSSYTVSVWDSANFTDNYNHLYGNKNIGNNQSSSSSVTRARMEVSASSSVTSSPLTPKLSSPSQSHSSQQSIQTKRSNATHESNIHTKDAKLPPSRNKPLLNSLVTKLDLLVSKMDQMSQTQIQIQKSFDNLESRYSLSSTADDVPQCGRRVDRVLRTLTPLVSRVEGLWNAVSNENEKVPTTTMMSENGLFSNINSSQSQFLGPPPNDVLMSESRRQERAISAIRNDLNIRTSQIMSELGTVEQQLDVLQTTFKKPMSQIEVSNLGSGLLEQVEQLPLDLQNQNDVTLSTIDSTPPPSNGSRLPNLVFPSVKNKPISDSTSMEGVDAFLTGSGQAVTSCSDMLTQGNKRSGLYHLRLPGARSSFWQLLAFCEQETAGGGWMVIQRRADFGEPRESFHRSWIEYRSGFGDPVKELWMGNLNLHLLTTSEDQVLRIELEDFDGEKRYAEYSTFKVASEADGFRLEVSGYSGDAGDALSDPWYGAHGSAFSTNDRDNDRSSLNCASMLKGGWWWKSCGRGLNGIYFDAPQPDSALARQGIVWFRWKGWDYTLRKAVMMIRPKSFRPGSTNTTTMAPPI